MNKDNNEVCNENENKDISRKNVWIKKLSLPIIIILIIAASILVFYSVNHSNNSNRDNTDNQNIPENGMFVEECKSSKYYMPSGGIFNIGDNKYFILGASDKTAEEYWIIPMKEPIIHFEIFDNKTNTIKKIRNPKLYTIHNSVQMRDNNIFIVTDDGESIQFNPYLAIINVKNFNVKKIINTKDIFNKNVFVEIASMPNDNIVIITSDDHENTTQTYIYNQSKNNIIKGPKLQILRNRGQLSIIALDNNKFIVIGGISTTNVIEYIKEIEICDIQKNICTIQKSKLAEGKTSPNLFLTENNEIIIGKGKNKNSKKFEVYDYKNDRIMDLFEIQDNETRGRSYTQLKNGDILISGGETGIMQVNRHKDVYVFDINKRELRKNHPMKYARSGHLTKVLNDGNVLICGGQRDLDKCEIYIPAGH